MEDVEAVEKANPEFAKLLDVLSSRYQEDGMPKSIRMQLKQVSRGFHTYEGLGQRLESMATRHKLGTGPPSLAVRFLLSEVTNALLHYQRGKWNSNLSFVERFSSMCTPHVR